MNTQTLISACQELLLIPMSQLRPSTRNVRKTSAMSIPELASSIARVGLLQNLTVTAASDGEHYEVVAGRRRLAALKLLAKHRALAKTHAVPCLVVADASARTVSLTENVQREAMHPADQFEAFATLVAEGRPIEDIAADFGVTPLVVQRRLKLANVAPRLLAEYRVNAVTLDQLMALAITDDHAAQEAAYCESPQWQRSPQALREHLTSREIDATRDALARFVGIKAYEAAGGGIRRDLFADDTQGAYLTDAALLDTLARERLVPIAERVRAEGWAWVEAAPRITHAELHGFQRTHRDRRAPSKTEAKRIAKLQARQRAIEAALEADDAEDMADEAAQALYVESDQLDAELNAIEESLQVYPSETIALAGTIVTISQDGKVVIHRGLLHENEAKALRIAKRQREVSRIDDGREADEATAPSISERLARQLSAHRTAALQVEVARHPQVALVALVHRLALRIVCDDYDAGDSSVNISASPQGGLDAHAPDVAQSAALMGMRDLRQGWPLRLPMDSNALFSELLAMPQTELLSLLAVCVASTVGAITSRDDSVPAEALALAVDLDMHQWWTPTAAGYFAHVSKARCLEAVEAFAPDQVARLTKLKKQELAKEAERLSVGSG